MASDGRTLAVGLTEIVDEFMVVADHVVRRARQDLGHVGKIPCPARITQATEKPG